MPVSIRWFLCCALLVAGQTASAQSIYAVPGNITVQPVIIVPSDWTYAQPTNDDLWKLYLHALHAQNAYSTMLKGRDTFTIANFPVAYQDPNPAHTLAAFSDDNGNGPELYALSAMKHFGNYDRYNNPYVYLILAWGVGGTTYGSSFNGGVNTGGGYAVIKHDPFWSLVANPPYVIDKLQSTIEHELGHAFGLPHSFAAYPDPNHNNQYNWCYGTSVMSYNPLHWTDGYDDASTLVLSRPVQNDSKQNPTSCPFSSSYGVDAVLLPEELNALSMNKKVFPNLYFDPEVDIPAGYSNSVVLGQGVGFANTSDPDFQVWGDYNAYDSTYVYSDAGEASGSAIANVLGYAITRASTAFDKYRMWMSGNTSNSWVDLNLDVNAPVNLSGIVVHTGYGATTGGVSGAADNLCVINNSTIPAVELLCTPVGLDDTVVFPAASSGGQWQFLLHAKSGSSVTVRGIQLLTPEGEIFPHMRPSELLTLPKVSTGYGEAYSSRVSHVLGPVITPNTAAAGYDDTTMWHSNQSSGWVSLQVTFPFAVTLNSVEVHSQHSGRYHAASQVQVEYLNPSNNQFTYLNRKVTATDDSVPFSATKAATWKIDFLPADGWVTIRGLRFHAPVAAPSQAGYSDQSDAIVHP